MGTPHTHDVALTYGQIAGLDSAFLVHNDRTYPHLLRLFARAGRRHPGLRDVDERALRRLRAGVRRRARASRGLFAAALDADCGRVTRDAGAGHVRFHRRARALLASGDDAVRPSASSSDRGRFTDYFAHHFVLPLVAAVWSCGFDGARGYPARYLFTFLDNHGALTVDRLAAVADGVGGSRNYVDRSGQAALRR